MMDGATIIGTEGRSADWTRGWNDGVWGTYANPMSSEEYDRGHTDGAAVYAVKCRAAVEAGRIK